MVKMTNKRLESYLRNNFDKIDAPAKQEFIERLNKYFKERSSSSLEAVAQAIWDERHTNIPITDRAMRLGQQLKQSPYSHKVAISLEIPRTTLYNKLKKAGLI